MPFWWMTRQKETWEIFITFRLLVTFSKENNWSKAALGSGNHAQECVETDSYYNDKCWTKTILSNYKMLSFSFRKTALVISYCHQYTNQYYWSRRCGLLISKWVMKEQPSMARSFQVTHYPVHFHLVNGGIF